MHNHSHSPQPPSQPLSSFFTTTSSSSSSLTTTTSKIPTPFILLATCLFSLLLILSLSNSNTQSPPLTPHPSLFPNQHNLILHQLNPSPPTPPSIAYLLTGSINDTGRILRLLYSIYHPLNVYLLHLDGDAPQTERDILAITVQSAPLFRAAQNVQVIGKPEFTNTKGSSSLSSILHGASILLRISSNWNWFIHLSASDYPLVTQDDLLHILSYMPKDLNFVNHSSYIGWKESRKLKPIIVDPALYLLEKGEMFYATQKRNLPDAYQLFTGSGSSSILSREFLEFSILGTDNLPRTLLMYLSNTQQSHDVYFPTVLCNSRKYNKTTINHSLIYSLFNSKHEQIPLNSTLFNDLIHSGAAFASPFLQNDPILDQIDREILNRSPDKIVPGGWCLGENEDNKCDIWGDANVLRPGHGSRRLENCLVNLFSNVTFMSNQCK